MLTLRFPYYEGSSILNELHAMGTYFVIYAADLICCDADYTLD